MVNSPYSPGYVLWNKLLYSCFLVKKTKHFQENYYYYIVFSYLCNFHAFQVSVGKHSSIYLLYLLFIYLLFIALVLHPFCWDINANKCKQAIYMLNFSQRCRQFAFRFWSQWNQGWFPTKRNFSDIIQCLFNFPPTESSEKAFENFTLGVITVCPAVWPGHLTFLYHNNFLQKMREKSKSSPLLPAWKWSV